MDYELAIKKIDELILNKDHATVLDDCINFLYENFEKYNWIGIYIVEGDDLHLGPWRGKQATEHTIIPIGEGICGSAAKSGKTEIISDVSSDERYLACFMSTKSEIVVPIRRKDKIIGEIDIDSDILNAFNEDDAEFLKKIADKLSNFI